MNLFRNLSEKISQRTAKVGIIGMGYVGKALADIVVDAGFETMGFVTRQEKADAINNGKKKLLQATTDISLLKNQDIILVCVQTPIFENKKPDLSYLEKACSQIAQYLQKGQLIAIESSIAPGTTRNIAKPMLETSELHAESDFFLSFSPERVDPGNKQFKLKEIAKVVSGFNREALALSYEFYSAILEKAVPVSSLEAAEMTKILENTFRLVNISLVNEVRNYTNAMGLDIWEIINAAATKPFGFLAHYPGPGIGGHCIPVDPYYLIDDAENRGINLHLIKTAGEVNDQQPVKVVEEVKEILHKTNGNKKEHKALLVGITYKPDIDDVRESPALRIWEKLHQNGIEVSYHDPYVPRYNGSVSTNLTKENITHYDVIVITTNHSNIAFNELTKYNKPILDTRNVYSNISHPSVFRL